MILCDYVDDYRLHIVLDLSSLVCWIAKNVEKVTDNSGLLPPFFSLLLLLVPYATLYAFWLLYPACQEKFLEPGVSVRATYLSPGIEERLLPILPSPDYTI